MEGLENMWSRFSLTEEEEFGAEVSMDAEKEIHGMAGLLRQTSLERGSSGAHV